MKWEERLVNYMDMVLKIYKRLCEEKNHAYKKGLYYYIQTEMAYNSNRIEGSHLSLEHTRELFTTKSLLARTDEVVYSNDVIETGNHFRAFDYLLTVHDKPLTQTMIKEFHRILKSGTADADLKWFRVGDYKLEKNIVGGRETTDPKDVPMAMEKLLAAYHSGGEHRLEDIVQFHVAMERIHPFQDGNGRVGRLVMFRECLENGVLPFIIAESHKLFYYRGLQEYHQEKGYLLDTCRSAQDQFQLVAERLVPGFKWNPGEEGKQQSNSLHR